MIKYLIARQNNGQEEYLHVKRDKDCFTNDTGIALNYKKPSFAWLDLQDTEYIVKLENGIVTRCDAQSK